MAAKRERKTNFSSLERWKFIEVLQNETIIESNMKISDIESEKNLSIPLLLNLIQMNRLQNNPNII